MPARNAGIAAILGRIADLLEIKAANPFRVRAYRNAARLLEGLPKEISGMLSEGEDLASLPGIGKDLAGKIRDIAETGRSTTLEQLQRELPPSLVDLLRLPGLGPKRVHALYYDMDVQTPAQLRRAILDGRLGEWHGFGGQTGSKLLAALDAREAPQRFGIPVAEAYAEPLRAHLAGARGVHEAVIAGSYRRCRETVGDIDILVAASDPKDVMGRFSAYGEVDRIQAIGPTRASAVLNNGMRVDLRVVGPESFGAALHYFTGSKAHNLALRTMARARGLKMNEYGIFKGGRPIAGATEESVFQALGLAWIPPELRENQGEIEAAASGQLPNLINQRDVRGDLHVHTTATDGRASLEAMAEEARRRGLDYIAITEHSRRLAMVHGLDVRRLQEQGRAIHQLNLRLAPFTLFKGIEVDILEDGSLDLPDSALRELDVVVAAVHSRFNLSREAQTQRILAAMANPVVNVIAHPAGRLIHAREPYDVDMPAIIRQARAQGCFLELNAHPERLDLLDTHCRMAKEAGVLIALNTDAHSEQEFDHLRYGIGQARRAWLEAKDVLNTRSAGELKRLCKRSR